jgi:hypothetical protein
VREDEGRYTSSTGGWWLVDDDQPPCLGELSHEKCAFSYVLGNVTFHECTDAKNGNGRLPESLLGDLPHYQSLRVFVRMVVSPFGALSYI